MTRSHRHAHLHRSSRPETQPGLLVAEPQQGSHLTIRQAPDLTRRGGTATNTCAAGDSSPGCHLPVTSATFTIPLVVGIVVPLTLAIIVLIFLQRRHVRKLRREEQNDRHKSLDFGMDDAPQRGNKKKKGGIRPEMTTSNANMEKALRRGRGLSMDVGLGNPYLLPAGLQSSRDSLHSLSRTVHGKDDPYRPATSFFPGDSSSMRSFPASRRGGDDSSSYTGSSRGFKQDGQNQNLLRNAQRMSQSFPQSVPSSGDSTPQIQEPPAAHDPTRKALPSNLRNGNLDPGTVITSRDSYNAAKDFRKSNNYLGAFIHSREASVDRYDLGSHQSSYELPSNEPPMHELDNEKSLPPTITVSDEASQPPKDQSLQQNSRGQSPPRSQSEWQYQDYHEYVEETPASYDHVHGQHNDKNQVLTPPEFSLPQIDSTGSTPLYTPGEDATYDPNSLGLPEEFDNRRMSVLRPLPPDDPTDNPEQRANRIRSFYKEYFSESEPARAYVPEPETYYEDYDQQYLGDGTVFDSVSNQFVVAQAPYAEPVTRRAMTPPPRAPPRFQQGPPRHNSGFSNASTPGPRSRAFSSASTSARFGTPGRGPPKKNLPPPMPLRTLPTPHLLKENAFSLTNDFAPPTRYQDRRAGRSDSPLLEMRPYSPALPVANPLASPFNELPAMPSPHMLRNSGLFTALDFAPPPRFKNSDAGSDAGSIRSGRSTGSAMSTAQLQSIRAGAYRVSRIPKEVVGTKDELNNSLKPKWDLNR